MVLCHVGTTTHWLRFRLSAQEELEGANEIVNRLETKYRQHIDELYATPEYKQKGLELIKSHFDYDLLLHKTFYAVRG